MKWGATSVSGTSALYFLPPKTTMNGSRDLNLLHGKLKLHMQVLRCSIFTHNAPCHRLKAVGDFLTLQQIQSFTHSVDSSDLNPSQNLWGILKNKVVEKQPSSAMEVVQVIIKNVWCAEISQE